MRGTKTRTSNRSLASRTQNRRTWNPEPLRQLQCAIVPARVCVFCRREPAQEPWIPFCSERCRRIDLNRWLNEDVSLPYREPDEDRSSDEPAGADNDA